MGSLGKFHLASEVSLTFDIFCAVNAVACTRLSRLLLPGGLAANCTGDTYGWTAGHASASSPQRLDPAASATFTGRFPDTPHEAQELPLILASEFTRPSETQG